MWNFNYGSVSAIRTLLDENGLSMSKRFGQNFLLSGQVLENIVRLSGAQTGKTVWEVGPGLGALTSELLKTGAEVTAFEIDRGFCRILQNLAFTNEKNFTLVEGDVLKTWHNVYKTSGTPDIICANLPYNTGSVFIASLIEERCLPGKMVYTLQAEVVDRICAEKGNPQYSGFSLLTSLDYTNRKAFEINPGNFWPAPKVKSAVVEMNRHPVSVSDPHAYIKTVRLLFSRRRQTVKNNIKTRGLSSEQAQNILEAAGISPTARAEELTAEQVQKLSRTLCREVF